MAEKIKVIRVVYDAGGPASDDFYYFGDQLILEIVDVHNTHYECCGAIEEFISIDEFQKIAGKDLSECL